MERLFPYRAALAGIVGEENVRDTSPRGVGIADGTGVDDRLWSWQPAHLKQPRPPAPIAATPADTAQVSQIVRLAYENGLKILPIGGRSNVRGLPDADIALDMSRLQAIDWDERSLTVRAGAGMRIDALEQTLESHGYTTGQRLRSGQLATVGGCVATNAVGLFSGRYGRFRDIVVELEGVRADGAIFRSSDSGCCGLEGAFGIVTEATLALRPVPDARAWAIFDFARRDDLLDAMRLVLRSDSRPSITRTIDGAPTGQFRLLMGFEGDELVQASHYQMAYAICQKLGGQPVDPVVGDDWLATAERSDVWAKSAQDGIYSDALAFFASWTEIIDRLDALNAALDGRIARFSWTLCHPTPQGVAVECELTVRGTQTDWERAIGLAWDAMLVRGGSIHHFGVGMTLAGRVFHDATLKSALDPTGVFPPWL